MSNGKKAMLSILVFAAIVLLVVGIFAFSKYVTNVSGTGTATVAKWSFKVNGSTSTISNVSLVDTTLGGMVAEGKIAPGTDGGFSAELDASGSEVSMDYIVEISNIQNKPTNLKFYSDSNFTTELTEAGGKISVEGSIDLVNIDEKVNIPIYWKWAYETVGGDEADTLDATTAAEMTFDIIITAVQKDPTNAI